MKNQNSEPGYALGSELTAEDQRYVLERWVNRYTGQHTPWWVLDARKHGRQYTAHFDTDAEWLKSSAFRVRCNGRIDRRYTSCQTAIPYWHPSTHEAP